MRTSFGLTVGVAVQCGMYRHKLDLDMLKAVKIKLTDVSSVSTSSEQK